MQDGIWPEFTPLHLRLPDLEQSNTLVIAYIRKNASTAFHKYLLDHLDSGFHEGYDKSSFRALAISNGLTNKSELRRRERTFAVLRCPLRRFYSILCNKIIARAGAQDVWTSIEQRIGAKADELSIPDFVNAYFSQEANGPIDVHFQPQSNHLWPHHQYTSLVQIEDVFDWSCSIWGADIARRYFMVRLNATEASAFDVRGNPSIHALQAEFDAGRGGPSLEWVLGQVGDKILEIYQCDTDLIARTSFWKSNVKI